MQKRELSKFLTKKLTYFSDGVPSLAGKVACPVLVSYIPNSSGTFGLFPALQASEI